MKKIYLLAFLFLGLKVGAQVTITATGATPGPTIYTTLKSAFDAINIGTHTGQISLTITTGTVETATAQLNATGTGGASYTGISIAPASAGITVSANLAASMITFNGASNVLINGGNNLTFLNSNTGGNTVTFSNDATKVAIKNTTIKGACTLGTAGVVTFTATGVITGNDNNTLDGCNIDGMSTALLCLYSVGTTTSPTLENSGDTLRNCNFYDNNQTTGSTYGVYLSSGNTDWSITGNSIYQTVPRTSAVQGLFYGLVALPAYTSDEHTISGNFIGGNSPGAAGSFSISSSTVVIGFIGMDVETGGPTNVVQNNTISNVVISYNAAAGSFSDAGIFAFIGGYNGTSTISGNTLSNLNFTNNGGTMLFQGIQANARVTAAGTVTPTFTITNNVITGITVTSAGLPLAQVYGLRLETSSSASLTTTSTSNPLFTVTGNNLNNITLAAPGTSSFIRGIANVATQGGSGATLSTSLLYPKVNISSNLINTFTSNSILESPSSGTVEGIHFTGSTGGAGNTTDIQVISQNTITGLSSTQNTDIAASVIGIEGTNGIYNITRNKVYDLRNAALGVTKQPNVMGIDMRASLGTSNITNNFIALGRLQTANVQFFGILNNFSASFPINVYFNSVLITGTGAGTNTRNSVAFMRGAESFLTTTNVATTINYKDNLFINTRTGGTGSNLAIANLYTTVPVNFTGNYNDLYSSNAATIGLWGTTVLDFPTWKTTSGQDANSVSSNVTFQSPSSGDLHLAPPSYSDNNLRGVVIPGLTTDFDGNQRSPNAPYMGASEGFSPLPIAIEYFSGVKQNNANLLNWKANCLTTSVTFDIQKSADSRNFTSIGNFQATHDRCDQPFNFADNNPFNGINYYRLKKTEIDGQISYSIIVAILNKESGFDIVGLLPNIVRNTALLNVTSVKATNMQIVISDAQGRLVQQQSVGVLSGSNAITLNFSKLGAGAYQLTGYTTDGFVKTIRFVKQ